MTTQQGPARLERWLGKWPSRLVIVASLVLVAAAMDTSARLAPLDVELGVDDWFQASRWPLLRWGLWAAAALVVVPLGLFLSRRVPHAALFLLIQLPLSYGVGYGLAVAHNDLAEALWDTPNYVLERPGSPRSGDRGGRPRGGRFQDRPGEPNPERLDPDGDGLVETQGRQVPVDEYIRMRQERRRSVQRERRIERNLPLEMGAYWLVLLLGLAGSAHLRSARDERRAREAEVKSKELERELLEAQLSSLESQLRPHFLFNALHSVSGLVRLGDNDKARAALTALGDLLRATLDQSGERTVALADEVEIARHYLAVEGIRYGERLVVREELADELLDCRVPALLLLPLVENAVRHAVATRSEPVTLTLEARSRGVNLEVIVADDGPPFPDAILAGGVPHGGGGIGISNTRARLANLFGDAARLELENPPGGGALVRVLIPLTRESGDD